MTDPTVPTIEQVWERYLELMEWSGFPNIQDEHKRVARGKLREIKQATPWKRRELYNFYTRKCQEHTMEKLRTNL